MYEVLAAFLVAVCGADAEIVTVPARLIVTFPFESTVATELLLLEYETLPSVVSFKTLETL